jgi:hypothetical protein
MKKLLTVAINSYNVAPLRGCINDSNNVKDVFTKQGYDVVQLVEHDATKQNIINALVTIGTELKAGDKFVFHYSGHGSQIPTNDASEEDGLMEILCPFDLINADGSWTNNFIMDKELAKIFNDYPEMVMIECLLDCCHSGTATRDLKPNVAYRYIQAKDVENQLVEKFNIAKQRDIICWSGCRDDQTSADAFVDGMFQGAFTASLLKTSGTRKVRYDAIVDMIKKYGFTQCPQLTCSDFDLTEELF